MRSIYILSMAGKPKLTIRQRIIYARLCPLRRPVPAKRLAEMLGGLIDRQTVSVHLSKLEAHGLVQQSREGWVALEPTGEIAKEFSRIKETAEDGRWHGCFASWRLPLPAEVPFPNARNRTELYCAYWLVRGLEQQESKKKKHGRVMSASRISSLLGVTKLTARRIMLTLRSEGLFDKHRVLPHNFVLQETESETLERKRGRKGAADDADMLDAAVDRLSGAAQIHNVINGLLSGSYMDRVQVCRIVESALKEHKRNGYAGDGSALVLNWLNGKLTTRMSTVDAGNAAVAESIAMTVRTSDAVTRLDAELAEERKTRKTIYEEMAAFALPGENIKPSLLRMLYTKEECEAALSEMRPGMTKDEICETIRPKLPVPKANIDCGDLDFLNDIDPTPAKRFERDDFDVENYPESYFAA